MTGYQEKKSNLISVTLLSFVFRKCDTFGGERMAVKDGNKRIAVTCTSQIEKELEWLSKNVYRKSKSKTLADMIHADYVFRTEVWNKKKK